MCVIIVKKRGVRVPTKSFLYAAALANPDGCGFATGRGVWWRGTRFDQFWAAFRENVRKDDDVIIHFRWATHGSVREGNCHPFMGVLNGEPLFFAHNGVLPIESVDDKTDSEIAFRGTLLPALQRWGGFTKAAERVIRETAGGSRFAFLGHDGVHLYGQYVDYGGLLLSNTHFLTRDWRRAMAFGLVSGVSL